MDVSKSFHEIFYSHGSNLQVELRAYTILQLWSHVLS